MKSSAALLEELENKSCLQVIKAYAPEEQASIRQQLEQVINTLIEQDFPLLVQWLYRIDVDEKKIKGALEKETGRDTASVLATLIIERQLKKLEMRKLFQNRHNIPEEDRW